MPITTVTSPITSHIVEPVMKLPPTTPNPCSVHSPPTSTSSDADDPADPHVPCWPYSAACRAGDAVARPRIAGVTGVRPRPRRRRGRKDHRVRVGALTGYASPGALAALALVHGRHPGHGIAWPCSTSSAGSSWGSGSAAAHGSPPPSRSGRGRHREVGRGHVREVGPRPPGTTPAARAGSAGCRRRRPSRRSTGWSRGRPCRRGRRG